MIQNDMKRISLNHYQNLKLKCSERVEPPLRRLEGRGQKRDDLAEVESNAALGAGRAFIPDLEKIANIQS